MRFGQVAKMKKGDSIVLVLFGMLHMHATHCADGSRMNTQIYLLFCIYLRVLTFNIHIQSINITNSETQYTNTHIHFYDKSYLYEKKKKIKKNSMSNCC